jgi:hypothetical protein
MERTGNISRRDFLKLGGSAAIGLFMPKDIIKFKETEPLTDLPILHTKNTPIYVEQLTRGGNRINIIYPGDEQYAPTWINVSDMPFDIVDGIKPEPNLTVPQEFGPLGKVAWVTDIPHVTGLQPTVLKAVVAYGDMNKPITQVGSIEYKKDSNIIATYAFTDRTRIYPAKIYNILTALTLISSWMKDNGPMTSGNKYSYLTMAGPAERNKDQYITREIMAAGGICASVSTISKLMLIAEQLGYMESGKRTMHEVKLRYGENPGDPAITKLNSDATVGFVPGRPDTYEANTDYTFGPVAGAPNLYLSFKANLKMNEKAISPQHPARHVMQPADARLTFTATLSTSKPDYDKERNELLALRDTYARFHNFNDGFRGSLSKP